MLLFLGKYHIFLFVNINLYYSYTTNWSYIQLYRCVSFPSFFLLIFLLSLFINSFFHPSSILSSFWVFCVVVCWVFLISGWPASPVIQLLSEHTADLFRYQHYRWFMVLYCTFRRRRDALLVHTFTKHYVHRCDIIIWNYDSSTDLEWNKSWRALTDRTTDGHEGS